MQRAKCSFCGDEGAFEAFRLYEKVICRPCAEKLAQEATTLGKSLPLVRIIDKTICTKCKTDYGSSELPLVGGAPFCATCAQPLYAYPYPVWLKAGLAGLLLVLSVALWRGLPYFKAGRHLVLAERALDRNDFQQARAHFAEVLKVGPTDQKVILLGAKANLRAGDIAGAQKFLNLRTEYESDSLFTEVNGTWKRAVAAYDKAASAQKLAESHQDQEAARLMHEASSEYPESLNLAKAALALDASAAFERKDYDGFLQSTRNQLNMNPDDPTLMGQVASALACKYAVTGSPEFRSQAEQALAQAQALAQKSVGRRADFEEYAERIRYRLETRQIIDKDEYDRRFRKKEAKK
jgi:hypothetical protein